MALARASCASSKAVARKLSTRLTCLVRVEPTWKSGDALVPEVGSGCELPGVDFTTLDWEESGVWKAEDIFSFLLPPILSSAALRRVATSSAPGPLHFPPHALALPPKKWSLIRGAPPDFNSLHILHFQSMYLLMLVANCHSGPGFLPLFFAVSLLLAKLGAEPSLWPCLRPYLF